MFLYSINFLILLAIFGHKYSLAGRPKPAYDCDDDKPDPRYHNEPCENDVDCFGHYMTCKESKCQCKVDAIPQERFVGDKGKQMVCDRAPGLNEKCQTTCVRPFQCMESPPGSQNSGKVCVCKEPYKLIDNECVLECKDDERYERKSYSCKKRCRANEVEIDDQCLPVAEIGGACQKNDQCWAGYSLCKNGQCACLGGFTNENGRCVPEEVNCPGGGAALMINNKPVACQLTYDRNVRKDSCPSGNMCFLPSRSYSDADGYCCPEATTSVCPWGQPDTQFTCSTNNTCPHRTHFCYTAPNTRNAVCCPEACRDNEKLIDGKRYPSRSLNDFCARSEQCVGWAECREGRCRCRPGFLQKGNTWYQSCEIQCKKDEVYREEKCHPRLGLGERCENEEWRCPNNAFCNKHKVCACRCPYFTLAKDLCAPVPRCPGLKKHWPGMRMGMSASMDMETAVKGYQPISAVEKQRVLENVTFCSAGASEEETPKVEVVTECGGNKYCARYITNLGMCCKKLETVCPNGQAPAERKMCKMSDATSCPAGQFCYDYLYTADPNSQVGTMCCPKGTGGETEDEE